MEKTRLSPVLSQRGHGGVGAANDCRYELTTRPHDSHQYSYTGMFHRQDDSSIVTYVAKNAAREVHELVGVDAVGLGIAPVSAEYGDCAVAENLLIVGSRIADMAIGGNHQDLAGCAAGYCIECSSEGGRACPHAETQRLGAGLCTGYSEDSIRLQLPH